jgi:hypothetical protein
MAKSDKRFALLRGNEYWYAVRVLDRKTGEATFRVSQRGVTRDAYEESERLSELETVARRVLLEGRRMRCALEGGPSSSLDLKSREVSGYRLDPVIAALLGVPPAS